jgi:hypothetical protein
MHDRCKWGEGGCATRVRRDGRIPLDLLLVLVLLQRGLLRQPLYPCQQVRIELICMGPHDPVIARVFLARQLRAKTLGVRDLHVCNADVVVGGRTQEHGLVDGVRRLGDG